MTAPDAGSERYVYVASSWRNTLQPSVIAALAAADVPHYDFRNPGPGDNGFRWTDVDPDWAAVIGGTDGQTPAAAYLRAIEHPVAIEGYAKDYAAMYLADTFVLLLPCGRSAHLELGWAVGQGKRTAILLEDPCVPELMYRMVDGLFTDVESLVEWAGAASSPDPWACPTGCDHDGRMHGLCRAHGEPRSRIAGERCCP